MNSFSDKNKYFFLTVFLLFLTYNVKFKFFYGVGTSYIVLILFLIYCFVRFKLVLRQKIPLLFCSFLVIYGFFIYILNIPLSDIGFIKYIVFSFFSLLVSGVIFDSFFKSNPIMFFKVFGSVGLVNACFIIVMLLFPSIQMLYLKLLIVEAKALFGNDILDGFFSLRLVGITGFSAYSAAFTQSICLFSYYVYILIDKRGKFNSIDYIIMFLIIISALISARSSIIGIAIIYFLMIIDTDNIKKNLGFLFGFIILLFSFLYLSSFFIDTSKYDFFYDWITELFRKGANVHSLETLERMFRFGFYDFPILGDSRLNASNGFYYMGVDVGYFRLLFCIGYLGMLGIILFYLSFVNIKSSLSIKCYFFTFFMILIFMIKGLIIFDAFYIIMYISLMSYSLREIDKSSIKRV